MDKHTSTLNQLIFLLNLIRDSLNKCNEDYIRKFKKYISEECKESAASVKAEDYLSLHYVINIPEFATNETF